MELPVKAVLAQESSINCFYIATPEVGIQVERYWIFHFFIERVDEAFET